MWENFGGLKFWRIATNEANGEEYFGESDGRSSEVSLYLLVLAENFFWQIEYHSLKFPPPIFFQAQYGIHYHIAYF